MKKEIEREIIKFDLERLRGKEVVVNCKTEEQFQNFIDWVNSLKDTNSTSNYWEEYKEESCLEINSGLFWKYGDKNFYKEEGYEIISYEEVLLKEPKDVTKSNNEVIKLQKKITNLQHSLSKKDEKLKNQSLEISSLLSQKQHLQQQLDSEASVKEKYSKSLIIIEYLENKLGK